MEWYETTAATHEVMLKDKTSLIIKASSILLTIDHRISQIRFWLDIQ